MPGNLNGIIQLEDPGLDGKIILKKRGGNRIGLM
jgi:hypothetical protein